MRSYGSILATTAKPGKYRWLSTSNHIESMDCILTNGRLLGARHRLRRGKARIKCPDLVCSYGQQTLTLPRPCSLPDRLVDGILGNIRCGRTRILTVQNTLLQSELPLHFRSRTPHRRSKVKWQQIASRVAYTAIPGRWKRNSLGTRANLRLGLSLSLGLPALVYLRKRFLFYGLSAVPKWKATYSLRSILNKLPFMVVLWNEVREVGFVGGEKYAHSKDAYSK
ncbi:hypothetical protein ATY78_07230 [Rhizobium sp. R635]|nr:hypothetical protein ATY78_07230 [Rhizobium sp. R635]